MTGLTLIVLILGAYRVWMLIAKDVITERLRERFLGYSMGEDGKYRRNRWPNPHKRLYEFISCPWCAGFWASLVASAAYYEWPRGAFWVLLPFAVSAGVALISVCFDRLVLDNT